MTDDLERLFREGLQREAYRVEAAPGLVDRAVRAARPRRRRATVLVVAAAAAVFLVAFTIYGNPISRGHRHPTVTTSDTSPWRIESWHGLQVMVPADWGWGTAPASLFQGALSFCGGPGATLSADGIRLDDGRSVPYVGRPIMLSDSCGGVSGPLDPKAPYVWFDADVASGTVDVGNGYTQQTVVRSGVRLTVGTDDPALRQEIIRSAAPSSCGADRTGRLPAADPPPRKGFGSFADSHLCVYQRDPRSGSLDQVYEAYLSPGEARTYYAAATHDHRSPPANLPSCSTDELAVVTVLGHDGSGTAVGQQTVVNLDCGWVTVVPGRYQRLDGATARAITQVGGLRVVLRSVIGMLG